MSMLRSYSQLQPELSYYRTIENTMWLYPPEDVEKALAATTYKYTYDGTFITCPDIENLLGIYYEIFAQTVNSYPIDNGGYYVAAGSFFQNMGKTLYWQVPNGNTVIKWQLVKQLTPQTNENFPQPGNCPVDIVGYTTT